MDSDGLLYWTIFWTTLAMIPSLRGVSPNTIHIGVTDDKADVMMSLASNRTSSIKYDVTSIPYNKTKVTYDSVLRDMKILDAANIHVIIGHYNQALVTAAERLNITYLCMSSQKRSITGNFIDIVPSLAIFSSAFSDLVREFRWFKVGVFFDDSFGISMIEHLMTNHDVTVRIWKISDGENPRSIRDFLIQMRKVWIQKVIVFCRNERARLVLQQARDLAMLSMPYEWTFFDPDGQCLDVFRSFTDVSNNFTILSLLPFHNGPCIGDRRKLGNLATSLLSDAFDVVDAASRRLPRGLVDSGNHDLVRKELSQRLASTRMSGKTGNIEFDDRGFRVNVTLDLSELIGKSATRQEPYAMYKKNHEQLKGNDKFEGYAIDLITDIGKMLGFTFNIYIVHDGKFGAKLESGDWNGLVGELLAGNATMSVGPLSINSQREEAIDFTKPFMTRYISVIMKKPEPQTSYFEFLNPLSHKVWICTFAAFVVISIVLYVLERVGVANRIHLTTKKVTLSESFWFNFGALLQGNTEGSPSSISGRIVTSAWWFFALILISSYTANLAAFLTVKKINAPIKSITDLPLQTRYTYGTVKDSGIMSFFQQTRIEHFAKMWIQMWDLDRTWMVENTSEGYRRVEEGNYAFFWDTTVNKYKTHQHCNLMEIGPYFDAKGFGIGVPPGATYKEELSLAILKLSDTGRLYELESTWWGNRDCPADVQITSEETSELDIENLAGVFFILIGGIVLSLIVLAFEKCIAFIVNKYYRKDTRHRGLHPTDRQK